MLEALIAVGLVLGMGGSVLATTMPPETLLISGSWLVAAGLGFGVPTGVVYHVALYRSLERIGQLPPGWYWRPTALHGRIPSQDRRVVLGFCLAGAMGLGVCVVGCGLVAIAAARFWSLA